MTRRPDAHVIGDQAVAAVRAIWNKQGAAVDEVYQDYGEDLLVKTCIRGRVDPRPIWVQVKGTRKNCLDENKQLPSVKISVRQLIRWSRFNDFVVVILWDVSNNIGWYTIPDERRFNFSELLDSGTKEVRLSFSRDDKFDIETADTLASNARLTAANYLVEAWQTRIYELKNSEDPEDKEIAKSIASDLGLLVGDIMHDLGIMDARDDGSFSFNSDLFPSLQKTVEATFKRLGDDQPPSIALDIAIIFALAETMSVPKDTKIPETLLHTMAKLVKGLKFRDIPMLWDYKTS